MTRILDKGGSPSWPFLLYLDGLKFFVHMNVTEYWNGETECQVTISNGVILNLNYGEMLLICAMICDLFVVIVTWNEMALILGNKVWKERGKLNCISSVGWRLVENSVLHIFSPGSFFEVRSRRSWISVGSCCCCFWVSKIVYWDVGSEPAYWKKH